jgi:hypothetical protein
LPTLELEPLPHRQASSFLPERDCVEKRAQRPEAAPTRIPPGAELHPIVYRSLILCIAIMVLASWLSFGWNGETDYLLFIVSTVFGAFIVVPTLIGLTARRREANLGETPSVAEFLRSRVETGSGPLTGKQTWIQIIIIPASLALAAILIGAVSWFTG